MPKMKGKTRIIALATLSYVPEIKGVSELGSLTV